MPSPAIDPKNDPAYLFKTPVEDLIFFGATEKERISQAIAFGRLRGIIQRFGQQITTDEFETIKACMQTCVNEG